MPVKKGRPETFRPSEDVAVWLSVAQKAGFNKSDIINSILGKKGKDTNGVTQIAVAVKLKICKRQEELEELLQVEGAAE